MQEKDLDEVMHLVRLFFSTTNMPPNKALGVGVPGHPRSIVLDADFTNRMRVLVPNKTVTTPISCPHRRLIVECIKTLMQSGAIVGRIDTTVDPPHEVHSAIKLALEDIDREGISENLLIAAS